MSDIKTFEQFITRMPRKTNPFIIFSVNHLQSFDLATLVRLGGKQKIEEFRQKGNKVTQRIASVDVKDYLNLPEEQKRSLEVSSEDLIEMAQVAQESHANDLSIKHLTTFTLPSVLLTYLFTIFDVYLRNTLINVYTLHPDLLNEFIQNKPERFQEQAQDKSLEGKVDYIIINTPFKYLLRNVFGQNVKVDMRLVWKAAKTSYTDLNKARIVRNLYVHRGGVSDTSFKKEMGESKIIIGEPYIIKFSYLQQVAQSLLFVAAGIDLEITARYPSLVE